MSAYGGKPCSRKDKSTLQSIVWEHKNWRATPQINSIPKSKRKDTSDKSEADTRIQGPNDIPNQQNFRGTQRANTRAHLLVVQRKEGSRGCHLGPADPLGRPTPYWAQTGPSLACRFPPHCLCWPRMVPPRKLTQGSTLGGLYKEEESPPFNIQQERRKSSTPRLRPST